MSRFYYRWQFMFCALILTLWQRPSCAQSSIPAYAQAKLADVHGVARLGGVPVTEVSIVVRSLSDNTARVIQSSVDGSFRVDKLNPGRYELIAKMAGSEVASVMTVDLAAEQSLNVDVKLNAPKSAPAADPELPPAVAKALKVMQGRIDHLEAELKTRNIQERSEVASAEVPAKAVDQFPRTLLATIAKSPSAIPIEPGTLARPSEKTVVASNAATGLPTPSAPYPSPQAGKAQVPPPPTSVAPAEHIMPDALQAPESTPGIDNFTPFAYGDFTWLNGTPRNKDSVLDTKFFTPEVRFDTHFITDFNQPRDHSMGGSTEQFRSGEVQVEQISVGGDFHWQNVRGRILTMMGMFGVTTPRNDPSPGVGQWDVRGAYKYVSEAYGGYHFNVNHGLNVDAGIFVSYIGLFSYYNFDNWAYQPSFVSSNTPWFFNGVRIQWFPTNKLKIEPWIINGWQSYNRTNGHHGFGGQILYRPKEWLSLVSNNYGNGTDTLGNPNRVRLHTDDSIEVRYYNNPENTGISKMAFSVTGDLGCEYGGGVTCHGGKGGPKQAFLGFMGYNRIWFGKDRYAITLGGGKMNNPGRYLTLLPPINGTDAISGSPYFTENPGDKAHMWDANVNFQWMPRQYITWWAEAGYRHSDVPYWSGRGGITPPGGNTGAPSGAAGVSVGSNQYVCNSGASAGTSDLTTAFANCGGPGSVWFPDLRRGQATVSVGVMVKF
jgi:hypothetical protein